MRILICNKFWYRRGGDCIYSMELEHLLKMEGHQTAVFAMQCEDNVSTEWSRYFPTEVQFGAGPEMLKAALRCFGLAEVRRKFTAILEDFKPDVVHLNNVHSQLSPVLAELAHRSGAKVVWTLHDYKLLCPRYDCRRNDKIICEDCFSKTMKFHTVFCEKFPVLKYSCMKNSIPASILAYAEAVAWNRKRIENCVDAFICPSSFMKSRMVRGGFTESKLHVLHNFIDVSKFDETLPEKEDYCCYVGRLSSEKGVLSLIDVSKSLPDHKFVIVGSGPLAEKCKETAGPNVEFTGNLDWQGVKSKVGRARFSILPSVCYENNPLTVIESKCLGTPVLGADIGGIPELIDDSSGKIFVSGDEEDMNAKIQLMFSSGFDNALLASVSRKAYGSDCYYKGLMDIYENI